MFTTDGYPWHQAEFVGSISRPKLHGIGTHAGVILPDGRVAHMMPEGAAIVSLADFAQGRPIRREKAAQPNRHTQLLQRAYLSAGRTKPYDVLTRNCEHYANWLLGEEEPKSPQVAGVLLACLVGIVAMAR